jgi:uncharacterized protein (TIGR03790 family)
MARRIIAAAALALCLRGMHAFAEAPLAPATIVVYNSILPDSVELAKFYAQKRGIARDHLVGLACPIEEEISRQQYETTIANPLREVFAQRGWWTVRSPVGERKSVTANSIRYVAIIRGVPLKVRAAPDYPGDKTGAGPVGGRNDASVDSELACLGLFSDQISGPVSNPYFQSYRAIAELKDATIMLVCRLDAPTAAIVRRMITDSIETEKTGLWGRAFVDGAHNTSGGLADGDQWLSEVVDELHKSGIPVVYDEAAPTFADGFPVTDCALYYGWYAQNVAGPFVQPAFRFLPGAVAIHIHSFSASTLREARTGWTGPVLAAGAAASVGNVYEPYLQLTPHLNILNDRLLHGFTFAESAYMSVRVVSWMATMVGDPLYRPYASWIQIDPKRDATKLGAEWKQYHEFAVKHAGASTPEYRTLARQVASRSRNGAMIEDLGLMELREGNFAAATNYFQQARASYAKRDDILRVVVEESDALVKEGKPKRALELVRSVLRIVSDTPAVGLLRQIEHALATPAETAPGTTPNE